MKKLLIILTILFTSLIITGYGILFYSNNRETSWPDRTLIQTSLNASLKWIEANQEEILQQGNPILWWMIQRSAALNGNTRLQAIFEQYRQKYLNTARNLWLPLFYPRRWIPFKNEDIAQYDDYQKNFVYAISCDPDLAQQPIIRSQLDPAYCDHYPLRPACATHQLMGFRLMQQNQCGDPQTTQDAVADLQRRIARQLTWDPRVVDVYIQRVLMLVESGATANVKPIWLQRVLDAQHADGGWGNFDPLIELPGGNSLGFSARGFMVARPESNFHATAQGVLLMSLLLTPST